MKVFKVTSTDWVAAETAKDAQEFLIKEFGFDQGNLPDEFLAEPEELSEEQMVRLKHHGCDGEYDPPITFKEELERDIAGGVEFPCLFATTEY